MQGNILTRFCDCQLRYSRCQDDIIHAFFDSHSKTNSICIMAIAIKLTFGLARVFARTDETTVTCYQGTNFLRLNLSSYTNNWFTDLFLVLEDITLSVTGSLQLLALEILVVDTLGQLHTADVDLRLGGDGVDLVDTAQGAAVDSIRTGDQEKTASQLLQEHDSLSLVPASDKDEHGARGDAGSQLPLVLTERLLA